jgi:hypothetical protein
MNRLGRILLITAALCSLAPLQTQGCVISQDGLQEAQQKSNAALVGTVTSILPGSDARFGRTFRYRLAVSEVLHGDVQEKQIDIHYFSGKTHLRGDLLVCPHLSGSGLEKAIIAGESYLFLLRTSPGPGGSSVEMIRAEPVEAAATVAALFAVIDETQSVGDDELSTPSPADAPDTTSEQPEKTQALKP